MARLEKSEGKIRITSPDDGGGRRLARFFVPLLIIVAALMITGVFAVRLEGGRLLVTNWLEKKAGIDLAVESVRIGWPYDLVVCGIVSSNKCATGEAMLKVEKLSIGLGGFRSPWRVAATGCILNMERDKEGSWTPRLFSRAGELPGGNAGEISRLTQEIRRRMRLRVRDSSVRWLGGKGEIKAAASGVSIDITPVRMPERVMWHYHLKAYNLVYADGSQEHDLEREWLASEASDYMGIYSSGRRTSTSGRYFWDTGN